MNSEIITFRDHARAFPALSDALQRCPVAVESGHTASFWTSAAKEVSPAIEEEEDSTCYLEFRTINKQEHVVSRSNEKKKS